MYVNVNNISVFRNAKELRGKGLVRDELRGLRWGGFCLFGFCFIDAHTEWKKNRIYTAKLSKLSRSSTSLLRVFLAIVK